MSLLLALLTLSSGTTLAADVTQSTTTALDAAVSAGPVSLDGASTQSTTSALDPALSIGSVSIAAEVTGSSTTALDPAFSVGALSLAGDVTASTTSALAASLDVGAVSLATEVTASTTTALSATATVGAVSLSAAVTGSTTTALDAVVGYLAPRGVGSLSLALPVRRASVSLPARSVSLALPRRAATLALPVRAVSLAITRRFAVADIQGFTQGDYCLAPYTLTSTQGGTAQTIAEPLSLVARLYARGSTTLVTSVSVTPGDCTGWGTTSVVVPVEFTSAISAALAVGTYSVWIVGTYANGTVRWPENGAAVSLEVRAPGSS